MQLPAATKAARTRRTPYFSNVVITFYDRAIEVAYQCNAFFGICVVTNHIAKADEVCAPASPRVRRYSFERLEIRVDVTENCEPHWQIVNGYNVTTSARGRINDLMLQRIEWPQRFDRFNAVTI